MAQTTRIKERQAAQAQRIKQAQAFMVPDNIDVGRALRCHHCC